MGEFMVIPEDNKEDRHIHASGLEALAEVKRLAGRGIGSELWERRRFEVEVHIKLLNDFPPPAAEGSPPPARDESGGGDFTAGCPACIFKVSGPSSSRNFQQVEEHFDKAHPELVAGSSTRATPAAAGPLTCPACRVFTATDETPAGRMQSIMAHFEKEHPTRVVRADGAVPAVEPKKRNVPETCIIPGQAVLLLASWCACSLPRARVWPVQAGLASRRSCAGSEQQQAAARAEEENKRLKQSLGALTQIAADLVARSKEADAATEHHASCRWDNCLCWKRGARLARESYSRFTPPDLAALAPPSATPTDAGVKNDR